ncbi:unnamed protein product [Symbiodinium natans]|uniref:Uncharacterized protein n=1 Tax=Symbiodinium natans TaxID=878477 RepID=A0A812J658_9DINO|nr:unnamed protein product [Symbiodinium natans]
MCLMYWPRRSIFDRGPVARMECEVCVVGLGVSSLPLLKLLQQSGTDFRVVSSTAFGIWDKLTAAGENFDLVTTIESTNYSWWDYDYDFPFYTAKSYHEKLRAELTPELLDRLIRKDVTSVAEVGGRYQVWSGEELLVTCSKLVHAIGFAPDGNIFSNLSTIANAGREGGKHFLIFGFSDTTNLYISRLIYAGHRVTLACRHFHVVDKIGITHGNVGGPFDQYEPMQHWTGSGTVPNVTGILVPLPIKGARVGSPMWVAGQITSYVAELVGLQDVVDLRKFDTDYQTAGRGLVTPAKVDVPGGLGYLVKQWPVDEYVRFYSDDRYRDWMLKEGVYLNDIYFFIQQGLVKLHSRREVEHISGRRYRLQGEEVEFDEVLKCEEARHKTLQMPFCPRYSYTDHLYGIWNRTHPNLYFLGTTRPYTGAFGCVAEVNAMFVHRMITDGGFHCSMGQQFPGLMHSQRVSHYVQASDPDKMHVHWAGMHCLWISRAVGCDVSFAEAAKRGLLLEWMTGPVNALRCRISGPYAAAGAAEKYKASCKKIGTNYMFLNMIYRNWGDRLVVASYFLCLLHHWGFQWRRMAEVERVVCILATAFLVKVPTPLAQLRGYLLMLAFDSLYHRRAWIMLLLNVLQFLFALLCILQGTDYGIPLEIRAGLFTDLFFLILGYLAFPRAFFADMRVRSPHAAWLFDTYLPKGLVSKE